ncbi:MAG: hypothetical protein H7281_05755 [Bacteriovorax sp.]|nr:hypothetical protein [Bacteriovorax sp.]
MKKKIFISLFILLNSKLALCEYRVFQYYVRPKIQNITIVSAELVTSTLDPIAYVAYHGGNESVEVNLLRSWQCMGNTSKAQVCSISEGRELNGAPPVATALVPTAAFGVKP